VLVSKDINLRIKASIFGVPAEDYENDRALDDFSLLYTGHTELPADFWSKHAKDLRSWSEKGHTYYELKMRKNEDWAPHQCLYLAGDDEPEFRVLSITTASRGCRSSTTSPAAAIRSGASTHATGSRISR
jgi:PhoH-like ATPase